MDVKQRVEQWGVMECSLKGPVYGNPFLDVTFTASFSCKHRTVQIDGFYDGDGVYKVRFMPDVQGSWSYITQSNCSELDGVTGEFECIEPASGNHGVVRVKHMFHFSYDDGTPYYPVGTTCYVWTHQGDSLEALTLETLKASPFNKMRMCVFPKHYDYNLNEPACYPFEGTIQQGWDFERFNKEFFRRFEKRVENLRDMGIEADIILFHPYDRWGYAAMEAETDDRYLRYVVARLAAYRNVWWSMANEYDFMTSKTMADWDRFFRIVQECDPYQHLRSIHNGNANGFYDHGKPWVTHCSIQNGELQRVNEWRNLYRKPVVVDECSYEGNINQGWGNITGEELVRRMWEGTARGGYVGHGETYMHPEDILWWSKGGVLYGTSPERIDFLRKVLEESPARGLNPINFFWDVPCAGKEGEYYLMYFGIMRPSYKEFDLPVDRKYKVEIIDTWEMTIQTLEGEFSGKFRLELPGKIYTALRIRVL